MAFRLPGANLSLLTVALLVAGSSSLLPTMAQAKVGVTSAADGDPRGKPPAEAERVLRVGVDVQANELITTAANDRAHLMFLDGTSLCRSVRTRSSPSTSSSTIPRPRRATWPSTPARASSVWSAARSARPTPSRSRRRRAPSASAAASAIFNVEQRSTQSIFVFGISMSVGAGGRLEVVTRPGFQVTTLFGGLPGRPGAVPPGALTAALGQLEGGRGGGQQGGGADQSAQNSGFSNANSGQGSGNTLGNRFGSGPGPRNVNPSNIVTNAVTNAFETAPSSQPTLPEKVVSQATPMQQTITYNGVMGGLVRNNGNTSFGTGTYQQVWSTAATAAPPRPTSTTAATAAPRTASATPVSRPRCRPPAPTRPVAR